MSLDVFIGIAGAVVTVLVVTGMILITPRGAVPARRANEAPRPRDAAPGAEPVERAGRGSPPGAATSRGQTRV